MMSQFGIQMHKSSKTKSIGNGKRKIKFRDRKRHETGNYFSATKLSEKDEKKTIRRRGGNRTAVMKNAGFVNLLTKNGIKHVQIKAVTESPDNRNFARQNILTKGSVITTDLGKAVITNRPGREGVVNAKLLE